MKSQNIEKKVRIMCGEKNLNSEEQKSKFCNKSSYSTKRQNTEGKVLNSAKKSEFYLKS